MMLVDTPQQLAAVVERYLQRGTPIYADSETTGLNPRTCKLVMVQMWQGVPGTAPVIVDARRMGVAILNLLGKLRWVFHNAKFDWSVLAENGVDLRNLYDSQIGEQIIMSASQRPSLVDVVEKYAGVTLDKGAREWFYSPAPLDERPEWDQPFPTEELEYAAKDVLYLPAVAAGQANALRASGQMKVCNLEMRAIPAYARMEMNGVNIDVEGWRSVIQEQEAEAARLYEELLTSDLAQAIMRVRARELDAQVEARELWEYEQACFLASLREEWDATHSKKEAGWGDRKKRCLAVWKADNPAPPTPNKALRDINLGSSQQLKAGLEELGIRLKNTEAEELEKAAPRFPALRPLVAWRHCTKFVSTYGENLLGMVGEDGRMHPTFHQIGAETGRSSSSRPNWQNIPARSAVGARLRACVQAPPGWKLLVADFPNIEVRIWADMSDDEVLARMFASGADMHTFTARNMFKLGPEITDEMIKGDDKKGIEAYRLPNGLKARDVAKTINFALQYGQTEWGFAKKFGVDLATARGYIEDYYTLFKLGGRFLKQNADDGLRNLYSTTLWGRRRYYNEPIAPAAYASEDEFRVYEMQQQAIRRAAMNHVIQGTSADMTKLAVVTWEEAPHKGKLVAVVHDEVVVECRDEDVEEEKARLGKAMMTAARAMLKQVHIPEIVPHVGQEWSH